MIDQFPTQEQYLYCSMEYKTIDLCALCVMLTSNVQNEGKVSS